MQIYIYIYTVYGNSELYPMNLLHTFGWCHIMTPVLSQDIFC